MKKILALIVGAFVALLVYYTTCKQTVCAKAVGTSIHFDVSVDKSMKLGDTIATPWCNRCEVVYIY